MFVKITCTKYFKGMQPDIGDMSIHKKNTIATINKWRSHLQYDKLNNSEMNFTLSSLE